MYKIDRRGGGSKNRILGIYPFFQHVLSKDFLNKGSLFTIDIQIQSFTTSEIMTMFTAPVLHRLEPCAYNVTWKEGMTYFRPVCKVLYYRTEPCATIAT